jgi:hypothetical protein
LWCVIAELGTIPSKGIGCARPGIVAGNQAPNALFWYVIFVVLLAGAWILVTR